MEDSGVLLSETGEDRRISIARGWLERCRRLIAYEAALRESADAQYAAADGLAGIDYSRDSVSAPPSPDAIPDAVASHIEMGDALARIAEDAAARIAEAADALYRLDDPNEAMALHLYYIDCMRHSTWEHVCVRMGYSIGGMMKLRRRALLHAYDVMPCRERPPRHPAI